MWDIILMVIINLIQVLDVLRVGISVDNVIKKIKNVPNV